MLFNSYIFWAFFVVTVTVDWRVSRRGQNVVLLIASYVFYGYWDWRFLSWIRFSTLVDYCVALRLNSTSDESDRKKWVSLSVVTNIGLLGFFKYFDFFVTEFALLLHMLGVPFSVSSLHVILPVGISFYTFQTLSYTIDVYRRHTVATSNLLDFAVYVAFFPQLVAGPIERSQALLPQLSRPRKLDRNALSEGLYHVLLGLFKKVVVADNMAPIVNKVFSAPIDSLTSTDILFGIYAFAFQIYGDFSGYSSIAQGIAKWLGINLSWNFKMPYFSSTPSEFWKRWHITLSSWLRDYLYVPLGGNRHGIKKTTRNLILTMALGGLWHGANWTFVVWGLYHGLLLAIYHLFRGNNDKPTSAPLFRRALSTFIFFHLICLSWLLFRADSMSQAIDLLAQFLTNPGFSDFSEYTAGMLLFYVTPIILLEYRIERSGNLLNVLTLDWYVQTAIYLYFVIMLIIFPPLSPQVFIYFQF